MLIVSHGRLNPVEPFGDFMEKSHLISSSLGISCSSSGNFNVTIGLEHV
jgi:hypothetical protein